VIVLPRFIQVTQEERILFALKDMLDALEPNMKDMLEDLIVNNAEDNFLSLIVDGGSK
jgi:hypothetical protein